MSGPVAVLDDEDVRAMPVHAAVAAVREALMDQAAGRLVAPPRQSTTIGAGALVLTIGGRTGDEPLAGFRVYDTYGSAGTGQQLVAVFDAGGGGVRAVVVGTELGPLRTGALGAVAVDTLARPEASVLGLVGSGRQARAQLRAIASVRTLAAVRVFSPTRAHRERLARDAVDQLGVDARAVDTAEEAVRDADVVVLATASAAPVIEADWVADGAHVSTVGPKAIDRHELPPELVDRAATVVTDAVAQLAATPGGSLVSEPGDLAAVVAGTLPGRSRPDDITLYVSTGLAGTEVYVAERLLDGR